MAWIFLTIGRPGGRSSLKSKSSITKGIECSFSRDRLALGCGEGSATPTVMISVVSDWPTQCPESMKVETWSFLAGSSLSWENAAPPAHLAHLCSAGQGRGPVSLRQREGGGESLPLLGLELMATAQVLLPASPPSPPPCPESLSPLTWTLVRAGRGKFVHLIHIFE